MQALRFLFSSSGRLEPRAFVLAIVVVYAAGAASHLLTRPDVIAKAGLWLFVAAQALLVWAWFALHAKRLRDAGRPVGPAAGIALLYVLSLVLLIIVAASFFNTAADISDANTKGALGLLLLASIIAALLGAPHYDVSWLIVTVLVVMAVAPLVVAVLFSLWVATRPSAAERG
jgi:uncharacterized membrane protein YhaH (DUF805 family)